MITVNQQYTYRSVFQRSRWFVVLCLMATSYLSFGQSEQHDHNRQQVIDTRAWYSAAMPTSNRNPFANIQALPGQSRFAITPNNAIALDFKLEMASLSSQNLSSTQVNSDLADAAPNSELLIIDGEIYHSEISLSYGINSRSDISITLPYIAHTSGFADTAIETWHDWFGLPNGNRNLQPRNALLHEYRVNGESLIAIDRDTQGIGDLKIRYRRLLNVNALPRDSNRINSHAIRSELKLDAKLATGNTNELNGSGAVNLSASLGFSQQAVPGLASLSWSGHIGTSWLEQTGLLHEQKKTSVTFASIAANWHTAKNTAIVLQIDAHTPLYNSTTRELGRNSTQLVIGLNRKINQHRQSHSGAYPAAATLLQFYFTEDLSVTTSPDIGFGFAIRTLTR